MERHLLTPKTKKKPAWPAWIDNLSAVAVFIFLTLISLFAIRSNDIWWHMAVGQWILKTRTWISEDPFLFSIPGLTWVPYAWLSDIIFYLTHAIFSPAGLVVLRSVIVVTVFALLFRITRRLGVSLAIASPVALVAILNAHSRFILRPHLFEYLVLAILLVFLTSQRGHEGKKFYIIPVALQILWVNLHASFYLGPLLVLLFYLGEWCNRHLTYLNHGLTRNPVSWGRIATLLVLMAAASFINPSPIAIVLEPLSGEGVELLRKYTLEWRPPFDPAMKNAAFHPFYEVLLALSVFAFVTAGKQLRVASLFIVGLFALLSLQAHRFRVEFAFVALPLVLHQMSVSPLTMKIRSRLKGRQKLIPLIASLVLSILLIGTSFDRIDVDAGVAARFPDGALRFVREQGVAKRAFQTIGFGSYFVWHAYPERQAFIDGRNLSAALHQDYLDAQKISAGFNGVVNRYQLDGFILPAPERSDAGITRLHQFLIQADAWHLVYIDSKAYVYVVAGTVSEDWLDENAYRVYHPMMFARLRALPEPLEQVTAELERARGQGPEYVRVLLDAARFYAATGRKAEGRNAVDRAIVLEPGNMEAQAVRALIEDLGR